MEQISNEGHGASDKQCASIFTFHERPLYLLYVKLVDEPVGEIGEIHQISNYFKQSQELFF